MSDETNAKPADKAPEPGEPQTPAGEPASAAHASEPIPSGQHTYPVKIRTPVRVTAGRVIKSSAVGLVGAGLLGGFIGGGVVALADNDNGRDRRPGISRQVQGTAQQFTDRGRSRQDSQQGQQRQRGQRGQQNQQGGGAVTPSY